jgi:hypothetical protein
MSMKILLLGLALCMAVFARRRRTTEGYCWTCGFEETDFTVLKPVSASELNYHNYKVLFAPKKDN